MREKLTALIIIILFAAFSCFIYLSNNKKEVLEVITPVMFTIDLNGNKTKDDGETVCLSGVKSYTANLTHYFDEIEGIDFSKGVAIGYLADNFAQKEISGKFVKLKFTGEKTPQCSFAELYTDNGKYSDILKSSGLGIVDGNFYNPEKAAEIMAKAQKLKLVIYNHKSEKFHKTTCEYGRAAHDAVILETKDLPSKSKPCKFCHVQKNNKNEIKKIQYPQIISDGSLKFIVTDFTSVTTPDRKCALNVCSELVKLINSSQTSIDIALYGWADIPQIVDAVKSALKRGVNVRVVYDTKTAGQNYYPETINLINLIKSAHSDDVIGNAKLTNSIMHNKFIIFDNKTVYSGSMNFSVTGLSGFNQNNVVIFYSPEIAGIYAAEFENMFHGKFHTLKPANKVKPVKLSDGSIVRIYFSPQDKGITKAVIPLVQNSKKYIYIPAFLITHKPLTFALISAKKRGVDVRIILDATSTGMRNSSLNLLRSAGVPVKIENYAGKMHSKSMIIDDRYVVSGSTNFSNSGENKNDENEIIMENPHIAKFYKEFFLYLWNKIPDIYLKTNPAAEGKYSIGSCSDGLDNDYDGKIDLADESCR